MRKEIIKAFAALMCSAAVAGNAAIIVTQAKEVGITVAHVHQMTEGLPYVEYEEANSQFHWRYVKQDYECKECIYAYTIVLEEDYLQHNLDGYADGKWYCTACGYEE